MNRNRVLCEECHGETPARRGDAERAHAQGGLPDLPHPHLRQGQLDEAALGLVDGRPAARRQALRGEGRPGRRHLHVDQGLVRLGAQRQAGVRLVRRHRHALPARRPRSTETPVPPQPSLRQLRRPRRRRSSRSRSTARASPSTRATGSWSSRSSRAASPATAPSGATSTGSARRREGMALVGLPYSGKLGFVETEMTWPINHMVAPKEQAVGCAECHTRDGSRLAGLTDFYLPGRDRNRWVDGLGSLAIALALAGVVLHAGARAASGRRSAARGASSDEARVRLQGLRALLALDAGRPDPVPRPDRLRDPRLALASSASSRPCATTAPPPSRSSS